MVSRETLISAGLTQLGVSHDDVVARKLARFAELLERVAVPRGYLGPTESKRIISRHVLEAAALVEFVSGPLIDVGSGAGLPGLVLACLGANPATMIEARARRVAFIREAAHEMQLSVDVVHGRAEREAHGGLRESAQSVTVRGVGEAATVLELALPLARIGGKVVLLVGEPDDSTGLELGAATDLLGGGPPEARGFEVPGLDGRRWVMIVPKLERTPEKYPRSATAMRRRPLTPDVT
jgi:16S rRNA (guanine527-N7)-methyltransferase